MRGAIQDWLIDSTNPAGGILMASLIFGLMHYLSRVYVILTTILGLLFGIALYLSGSILLVIVAHTVYDILAFFIIVKRPDLLGLHSPDEDCRLPINEHY